MSLIKPFSYIHQVPQTGGAVPFESDMLFWFTDPDVNVSGTVWSDASTANTSTATLVGAGTSVSGSHVAVNNSIVRTNRVVIKPTSATINVKSLFMLFTNPYNQYGASSTRNYFYDCRDANAQSPDNAGFFNQYDSTSTASDKVHGNDATFFAYGDGLGSAFNGGTITTTLLTDGSNNNTGGDDYYQWLGPTGRSINNTKRIFFFNYNSNRDVQITTTNEGWYFATNDAGTEGGSFGYYEIIGYDRALSFSEFETVVQWVKDRGLIT